MNALQQESEAGQAGLTSLGSAVTPASPYFPNVPLILLGALGFGAAVGALSGLLFELLNRRIRREGDIVHGFDMPLLAVMTRPEDAGLKGVSARLMQFLLAPHGIFGCGASLYQIGSASLGEKVWHNQKNQGVAIPI